MMFRKDDVSMVVIVFIWHNASITSQLDLHSYCHKEKRTYVETLEDFPSCRVPLDRFLDTVPAIRPRLFSISSAMVPSTPLHPIRRHFLFLYLRNFRFFPLKLFKIRH